MRYAFAFIIALIAIPFVSSAGEKEPPKLDYVEISKLVHQVVVKSLPKQFEDTSGWGATIPVPAKLPLPNLRTYLKVGDQVVLPHGTWRRFAGKLEEPNKNLKIMVKDFKALDEKTYRLVLDVDVTVLVHGEWQQWQKGLMLVGAEGTGDANLTAAIVCDIGVKFDITKFPPDVSVTPTVKELGLDLVDFRFRNATGPAGKLDPGPALSKEILDALRAAVKASEPLVKDYANQAIAQGLKEGKGTISSSAIMKAVPPPTK